MRRVRRSLDRDLLALEHQPPHLGERFGPGLRAQAVDEEDPIEVVRLVRQATGEALGTRNLYGYAMHVETPRNYAPGPWQPVREVRDGQAALDVVDLVDGFFDDDRINEMADCHVVLRLGVVDPVGKDPETDTDLRSGQTDTAGVVHRVLEVANQAAQRAVEVDDLRSPSAQYRISYDADPPCCHSARLQAA